jgi:hypothetical protein
MRCVVTRRRTPFCCSFWMFARTSSGEHPKRSSFHHEAGRPESVLEGCEVYRGVLAHDSPTSERNEIGFRWAFVQNLGTRPLRLRGVVCASAVVARVAEREEQRDSRRAG